MIERGLTARDFCLRVLQVKIDDLGADAFAHTGNVVLYSGPNDIIKHKTKGMRHNPPRSEDQAQRLNATRIDDTAIGKFFEDVDLYAYFGEIYGDEDDIRDAVREVWEYASAQFMHAGFREAATAVCGAAPDRIFRKRELAEIVDEKSIKVINGRDMDMVRQFHALGSYEAFRLICLTELLVARRRVHDENTVEAWEDYRARQKFFILERQDTIATVPKPSASAIAALKEEKKKILATYRLKAAKTEIEDVTDIDFTELVPIAPLPSSRLSHGGHSISHAH